MEQHFEFELSDGRRVIVEESFPRAATSSGEVRTHPYSPEWLVRCGNLGGTLPLGEHHDPSRDEVWSAVRAWLKGHGISE